MQDIRRKVREKREGKVKPDRRDTVWGSIPRSAYLTGLGIWVAVVLVLSLGGPVHYLDLTPGQKVGTTIAASVDFAYTDLDETELERQKARENVLNVWSINQTQCDNDILAFCDLIERISKAKKEAAAEKNAPVAVATNGNVQVVSTVNSNSLTRLIAKEGLQLDEEALSNLVPETEVAGLIESIKTHMHSIYMQGITDREKSASMLVLSKSGQINLSTEVKPLKDEEGGLLPVRISRLLLAEQAADMITSSVRMDVPDLSTTTFRSLLANFVKPNLDFDAELTKSEKQRAGESIQPELAKLNKGATIVAAGAVADEQICEMLAAHREALQNSGNYASRLSRLLSYGTMMLSALFILGGFILVYRPGLMRRTNEILLAGLLSLIPLVTGKVLLLVSEWFPAYNMSVLVYLIPISLAPLVAMLMMNTRFALIVGMWTSFAVAVMLEQRFSIFILGMLVTVVATLAMRRRAPLENLEDTLKALEEGQEDEKQESLEERSTRTVRSGSRLQKRSNVVRAGFWIGLAQAAFVLGVSTTLNQQHSFFSDNFVMLQSILPQLGVAFIAGFVSAFLALLLTPLLETAFNMTSDIRLLELSDMGHPLLQRLAIEAPGTLNHSLMVAHLAQSAARDIGGRDLLVRVCAYYHDIGKLVKPEFFIENNRASRNPHDDLTPNMSTIIITAHVKEGLSLARRHKLPPEILEAINTHHGKSVISYFYHRAKEEAASPDSSISPSDVNKADFRYPGPLPKSPEMSILMLADSVEAASRSLEKPTASNITSMVNGIVEHYQRDGQLDSSQLTFSQLAEIKKSFVFHLTNMLHTRISYPKDDEDRNPKPSDKSTRQRRDVPEPSELVHEDR